ncbi:TPA: hypothetical protein OXO77_001908 [Acinetobacter baumannii]|uniref:hypothetical protein n=1 Tax=Acinetobacter baumannii TaxID=470 RepID=UPI00057CE304|nr:hypothetical protein [Acinetobacter baumannii]ELT5728897.1 hypothetical protein [Acinetobacter baumannii]ELY0195990.1 hypothetical protein [Acinetobacter baumannii]ELY0263656.1 hypothetical protein [Acinetobacter baumannii]ELY0614138.1 hypothetical protein [Acinetobacter baumannii]ELY0622309.1 hypothetical protein [Acinetobacter baumannii]
MSTQFQSQADFKQTSQVQSFYEPAMAVVVELMAVKKRNLKSKGYDENNAAIAKEELRQALLRRFRINHYMASQIVTSLAKSGHIREFGGYVAPKAVSNDK